MKKFLLSFLCFLLAVRGGYAVEVTDVLNQATTGVVGQNYTSWSGKTLGSKAVYAGQSAGDYESIQLRSKNSNSGIITTTSGGKVKKIMVVWNSNTTSGRILDVYGKNTAYSSPADLYGGSSTQGTKLGSIKYGTSTELVITGDYEYIGLRSNSGAMYLTSISITWENGESGSGEMQKPSTPSLLESKTFVGSMDVEITCATEDADIYYTTDGTIPTSESDKYIGSFNITDTKTINAVAINEAGPSSMATATYTRVAESPEILFDGESTFEGSKEVTVTIPTGTTVYYTLNGKTPTKDSDECPETLTLKADATLQVIAFDEDGYASPVVKQAFEKSVSSAGGAPAGTATLVKDVKNLNEGDQVVIVASGYNVALSKPNSNGNNFLETLITKNETLVDLNDNVTKITLQQGTKTGTFAFLTDYGYLYAASSSSNHLKTKQSKDDNGSWKIEIAENGVATIKAQGTSTHNWLRYNDNQNNGQLFSCYGSGQADVSLYKVNIATIEDYTLNMTKAGWSTLYLGYNTIIPEDVTCYVASEVGEESVQLTEVKGVLPANTAVIVNAEEGKYTFEVTEETATVESIMAGTTKNEYIRKDGYILAQVDENVGLYKAAMNGGVFLNNANKAYLPASALPSSVQNAKALKFDFNTTAVESVKVETEGKKVIYDLSGRRVNDMTAPGLYIVNGKKVMVK